MHRLPRFVSAPTAVILAGCIVIGIAYFVLLVVERPTYLNVALPMFLFAFFGQTNSMLCTLVLQIALILAFMMVFAVPAYAIAWMFRRIIPNHVLLIAIGAWLLCYLYLFMVGPGLEYYSLNESTQNERPGWHLTARR